MMVRRRRPEPGEAISCLRLREEELLVTGSVAVVEALVLVVIPGLWATPGDLPMLYFGFFFVAGVVARD